MIRLPVPRARIGGSVALTEAERHYLVDVLRLSPGAALELFDGEGGRYEATLTDASTLAVGARREDARRSAPVVVAQGLAKADKVEWVVEKSVELGAAAVWPFAAERSVVKLAGDKAVERVARWQKIAESAARQSGRADTPRVEPIVPLAGVLARAQERGMRVLLLDEAEQARGLLTEALGDAPLVLVVGPEGGIADGERAAAHAAGAVSVTLGKRVLRTETAALACLAALAAVRGEFG